MLVLNQIPVLAPSAGQARITKLNVRRVPKHWQNQKMRPSNTSSKVYLHVT